MLQSVTVSKIKLVVPFVKGGKSGGMYFQLVRLANAVTCHPCDIVSK